MQAVTSCDGDNLIRYFSPSARALGSWTRWKPASVAAYYCEVVIPGE
jgi:hypothetical protein